jgi:hypothetical protein
VRNGWCFAHCRGGGETFEIFDAKGDVAAAAQFRSRLSSLGVEVV